MRELHRAVLSESCAPVAAYVLQAAGVMQLVPLYKQPTKYAAQVVALGLEITSVHALALQALAPVAYPHKLPAPSLVALQATADVNVYVEQAVAATH